MEEGDKVNDSQPPTNIYLQATGRNKTKEETLLHLVVMRQTILQWHYHWTSRRDLLDFVTNTAPTKSNTNHIPVHMKHVINF